MAIGASNVDSRLERVVIIVQWAKDIWEMGCEYSQERRFQDLTPFASTYFPTKHHKVDMFRDGLRQ